MDRATKFRSLGVVKRRGGWKQDKCVARYEKGSRLGSSTSSYVDRARRRQRKRLEDSLIHVRTDVPPGALARCSRVRVLRRKLKLWKGRPGQSGGTCWISFAILGRKRSRKKPQDLVCERVNFRKQPRRVLFCFVLFCFVLFCFVLFCFVLFLITGLISLSLYAHFGRATTACVSSPHAEGHGYFLGVSTSSTGFLFARDHSRQKHRSNKW